ncbi:hypothetical protein [Streptomyces sp. NPDC050388]|uniref:hypothetical protein n=1 Tax=Streptomyces sp. NPDC050388 TaxID=3155781 RepID=UPI00342E591C
MRTTNSVRCAGRQAVTAPPQADQGRGGAIERPDTASSYERRFRTYPAFLGLAAALCCYKYKRFVRLITQGAVSGFTSGL